jgi:hypothetical protein
MNNIHEQNGYLQHGGSNQKIKPTQNNENEININKQKNNSKKDLEKMIDLYLASNPIYRSDGKTNEIELRFGTNHMNSRPYTRIDYENTVKHLHSAGFETSIPNGTHLLRIQNEFINEKTGMTNISKIRTEINGLDIIQEYCKTNSIQHILDLPSSLNYSEDKIKFTMKSFPTDTHDVSVKPVDFYDFNFRVSYQLEQDFTPNSNIGKNIIKDWNNKKKIFRYINRTRFEHPILPIFADISIVKMNKMVKNKFGKKISIPTNTIEEAEVFKNNEIYEIEIELDNKRMGNGTAFDTTSKIIQLIHKSVRLILGGIQGTNYPISIVEMNDVLQSYMKILYGEKEYIPRKVSNRDFIGPSSFTLQIENIIDDKTNHLSSPNIRKNYTVTDKADGERKLLYIHENGRLYMIDTNMNVIFTGTMTKEKIWTKTIIDGEHIKYDKHGNPLNLYAAFDLYYLNNTSKRELAFIKIEGEEDKPSTNYRLELLNNCIKGIKPFLITQTNTNTDLTACNFIIKCKSFYPPTSIFKACYTILSNVNNGIYQYNTDGLIFTPANTGVGSNTVGIASPIHKREWDLSFKWKPPAYNTIDFLVSVKKDKNGNDEIHTIYKEGVNTTGVNNFIQYKTLILRCGFNEKIHGFLNPFQSILDDKLPSTENYDNIETENYRPVPFQPTNPYDPTACFANILLSNNDITTKPQIKTEEGEYFEENMIVEFKYDLTLEPQWRWVPLRVRYDKTAQLRSGILNYGNAYHVANNNWYSIHHPITEEMISTGVGIPEISLSEDEVYYNKSTAKETTTHTKSRTFTNSMRNFHNLYIKKKLILGVAEKNNTLIDYAVGKAGDLSKWVDANLKFIFGIDISRDNIHNNLDGACARYLKSFKKYKKLPSVLFVNGNSSNNIRKGEAFSTEKDKMVANSVFGNGPKDRELLGEGVYKNYGIAHDGFNISSCQFALHYFFENVSTLNAFVRNLAECTMVNGYFIGTCFDGSTIFQMLKNKSNGDGFTIMKENVKICEITKLYDQTGFPDDENSLGYPINVYQETINKVFREYLVNFNYFIQIMENYGFVLLTDEEASKKGFSKSTGLFSQLYNSMKTEIEKDNRKLYEYGDALQMSNEEKQISFMNRYFIFKKVRNVDAKKEEKIMKKNVSEDDYTDDVSVFSVKDLKSKDIPTTEMDTTKIPANPTFIKKLKFKLIIKPSL